jgi:hypothetical protein
MAISQTIFYIHRLIIIFVHPAAQKNASPADFPPADPCPIVIWPAGLIRIINIDYDHPGVKPVLVTVILQFINNIEFPA